MKKFMEDLKHIPTLMVGFALLGLGIWIIKEANIGMPPWDCLTQGFTNYIPLTFGQLSQLTGLVFLIMAMLLKVYPGIGTILNLIFIGVFFDIYDKFFNIPTGSFVFQVVLVTVGSFLMSLGMIIYIRSALGQGPRDSLIFAIYRLYSVKYGFIKFGIESVVLVVGILLGGKAGLGTVLSLFLTSFFIQEILNKIKLDPREIKHTNLQDYRTAK